MSLEQKTDERGTLVEAFRLPNDGQIFYVKMAPGSTRGNHYHLRKTEHFVVVEGSADLVVRDRATGDTTVHVLTGGSPEVISVAPRKTHAITSANGCLFLVWCDELYDSSDADTYAEAA